MPDRTMLKPEDVTRVKDAIHNPSDPRHFMRIKPLPHPATAAVGGTEVVRSCDAVRVQEAGRDLYDPVVYFPRADIRDDVLRPTGKTTHCPLKGDTEYYDVVPGDGTVLENAAWSYVGPWSSCREHPSGRRWQPFRSSPARRFTGSIKAGKPERSLEPRSMPTSPAPDGPRR